MLRSPCGRNQVWLPRTLALIILATAIPRLVSPQDTVTVRGANASCASCRVELTREAVMRAPNTEPGLISPYMFARDSRGRLLFNDPFGQLGVRVFSRDGRYERTVGKKGQGPGEFLQITGIVIGPQDTIHVYGNAHWVFDAQGTHIRTTSTPGLMMPRGVVQLSGGGVVLNGTVSTPEAFGHPYHLVGPGGSVTRSFGLASKEASRGHWSLLRVLAAAGTNEFLAGRVNSYTIELWSTDGRLRRVVRRMVEWYPDWIDWDSDAGLAPPPPRLMALAVDSVGLLWTVSLVADARWKPLVRGGAERRMLTTGELVQRFDAIVEVIDLSRGQLVASQRFPQMLLAMPAPGLLVGISEDESGEVVVGTWRARLLVPD